jgi:membrane protein implicated in regulation of membrane protease activity
MEGASPATLWLIGGAVLCIAEIIAPGFFLVWIGAAALITGALTELLRLSLQGQAGAFALIVLVLVLAARKWLPYQTGAAADPLLNNRTARLIGQTVEVSEAISASTGRVKVGDGAWQAKGCVAEVGAQVVITGAEGNVLIVERP